VLIIGGSGQVGAALIEAYGEHNCVGTYCASPVPGMVPFDLSKAGADLQKVEDLITTIYPTVVCICAGWTFVDGCESDPAKANALNNAGPAAVAAVAKKHGAKVVWYSTDYVFDGGASIAGFAPSKGCGPYGETDPVAPLNVYGSSKLAGEAAVLAADPSALVIRTNVVFGPEGAGKNFIYQLCRNLQAAKEMKVPTDQINTPTYNRDLAACTKLLVEANASGVYNIGGSDVLGRYDFARAACVVLNELRPGTVLDASLLTGVTTSNAGQAAKRPLASGLKLDKTQASLLAAGVVWKPRTVQEALKDWVTNPRGKPLGE